MLKRLKEVGKNALKNAIKVTVRAIVGMIDAVIGGLAHGDASSSLGCASSGYGYQILYVWHEKWLPLLFV